MSTMTLPQQRGFGQTSRVDAWWVKPFLTFLGFSAFVVYSTWAAFQGDHYTHGPYLSPFYSPELFGTTEHAWIQGPPTWWPSWMPFAFSPAFLILWAPAGFRFTCYYYRGSYYKAFWGDPPNCAVGEPRKKYLGEQTFPLILQNVHRYFMYIAVIFIGILAWDAWKGYWFAVEGSDETQFGIGVGSLVLTLNVILLGGYTFGCHSLRHLVGGIKNQFSHNKVQYHAWKCVTCLNGRHANWAWFSLFWVGFTDVYVRMCSLGHWSDWRIL